MSRKWIAVFVWSIALANVVWTTPEAAADAPHGAEIVGVPALDGEVPRGVYVIMPTDVDAAPPTRADYTYAGATIIYMNRMGGTYTPGYNDAHRNR